MHTLPGGHVPRPRLVEELAAAPVGLVEAPGGYGKSVLAAELADYLGIPALEADALGPIADAPLLVAALRHELGLPPSARGERLASSTRPAVVRSA